MGIYLFFMIIIKNKTLVVSLQIPGKALKEGFQGIYAETLNPHRQTDRQTGAHTETRGAHRGRKNPSPSPSPSLSLSPSPSPSPSPSSSSQRTVSFLPVQLLRRCRGTALLCFLIPSCVLRERERLIVEFCSHVKAVGSQFPWKVYVNEVVPCSLPSLHVAHNACIKH